MAQAKVWKADVTLELSLAIGEKEARALVALTAYGADSFLKSFYEHMGTSCLKPHEAGLRLLFETARSEIEPLLARADAARREFGPVR